jgi:hypothetical protein
MFSSIESYAQTATRTQLNGLLTIGGQTAGTNGGEYTVFALFNNQTGAYTADSMIVGDQVWDGKGDRYVVVAINAIVPNVSVDVDKLNDTGTTPSTGIGVIFRPTINYDYPLITSGLPDKLLAAIETHRAIEIDEDISLVSGDADPNNEIQTISQNGNTVTLSNGGGSVSVEDGDSDATNEFQDLSIAGQLLTISDGNTVTIPGANGSETAINAGTNVTVTGAGTTADPYLVTVPSLDDADADATNEFQDLSIAGQLLSIANGNSVTLPNADGSETNINAGTNVSVTGMGTTSDPYVVTVTSLDDADADPTNEFQDLNATSQGNLRTIGITNGAATIIDIADNDNDPINELHTYFTADGQGNLFFGDQGDTTLILNSNFDKQFLQLNGNDLGISNGNIVTLPIPFGVSRQMFVGGECFVQAYGDASTITYSRVNEVATLTIPSGVYLMHARINGETANMNGSTSFTLKIVDQNGDINQGTVATFFPPETDFIKRDNLNNDPPTATFPFANTDDNPPTPQVHYSGYGAGEVELKWTSIDSYAKWTAVVSY